MRAYEHPTQSVFERNIKKKIEMKNYLLLFDLLPFIRNRRQRVTPNSGHCLNIRCLQPVGGSCACSSKSFRNRCCCVTSITEGRALAAASREEDKEIIRGPSSTAGPAASREIEISVLCLPPLLCRIKDSSLCLVPHPLTARQRPSSCQPELQGPCASGKSGQHAPVGCARPCPKRF